MKMKISILYGITTNRWFRLLWQNRFAISPRYTQRALLFTFLSMVNSYYYIKEKCRYSAVIANTKLIEPPLFIIGHWRSGTSHLQNLLAKDPQFATPNTYQVIYPDTFLTTEETLSKKFAFLVSSNRPADNMVLSWEVPNEDEMAMSVTTLLSPYLSWCFPRNGKHYNRYLTFRGVSEEEVQKWKMGFIQFVKKMTYKYQLPLILKSPTHTCRIKLLLEMFPDARFVHIIRSPYRVFQSMMHLFKTLQQDYGILLQQLSENKHMDIVLNLYNKLHEAYFDEVSLIPKNRLHLMRYEDIEQEPIREMRRLYKNLNIPNFDCFKPFLKGYLRTITDYNKNNYPPLDSALRHIISTRWRRSFIEWGYAIK